MEDPKKEGVYRPYKPYRRKKFAFVFMGIFFAVVVGFVIMFLWNWLMPAIFNLGTINYWQALGLLILSRILFGGWIGKRHHHTGGWYWRRKFMKKWENMSEEDRNKMKEHFKSHCF